MLSSKTNMEETDLFSFTDIENTKAREKKIRKRKKGVDTIPKKEEEQKTTCVNTLWKEKFYTFDITHKMQEMKDKMKEEMVQEGFTKREANTVLKGLFFKELVHNTPKQAEEYLKNIPNSYAVKYKIGIPPSPQMISLKERLSEKKSKLKEYEKVQSAKKFTGDFYTCSHCKSRVNASFVTIPVCPVCKKDMRSDHVLETLQKLETAVQTLTKKYENTTRKRNSKFTGGEKWIIRLVNPFYKGDI